MLKIYGYVPRSHASLDPVVKSLVGPLYGASHHYYDDFQDVFNSSPDEYAGPLGRPMLDRSAVGQLSSLSGRTK